MEDERVLAFVRGRLNGEVVPSENRRSRALAAVATAKRRPWVLWSRAGLTLAASVTLAVLGFWNRMDAGQVDSLGSVLVLLGSEVSEDEMGSRLDEAVLAWQDAPYLELAAADGVCQK